MYAAYRGAGHRSKPTLQPIAVGEPFEQVGVDIEMPRSDFRDDCETLGG